MKKAFVVVITASALLAGCGADRDLRRARRAEANGDAYKAWKLYQEFAAHHPKHAGAAEAVFRAGWLAERKLSDCHAASTFYNTVVARYPQADPWARLASHQQANCPDYFPLAAGSRWVEGDSESGGKNARIEITAENAGREEDAGFPSPTGWLVRTFYAGDSKFRTTRLLYKKEQGELREYQNESDDVPRVLLKWPLHAGTRWKTRIGDRVAQFEIVEENASVRVRAGQFDGCLHVRWTLPGIPGATNEYYAPGVGKILTSYTTGAGEKRKTELLSHEAPAIKSS